MRYQDATLTAVDEAMENSVRAFEQYQKLNLAQRAAFLEDIGKALEENSGELILTAAAETNLETARLKAELARTVFQLRSYAKACAEGSWLDVRIDTPFLALSMAGDDGLKKPGAPDLRKMLVPLGPVVVFGASNFPFAYSTAGGDTACALAAGCTVVVKAHPAHAHTSELVAGIIDTAAKAGGLPEGIFIHLHGSGFEVGKALVEHRHTKAVGFTGSYEGGRALFDLASARTVPIPVFAEMGSVNPVFLLPRKLGEDGAGFAKMFGRSITQSAGQFCTNPGLMIGIGGAELDAFEQQLAAVIRETRPVKMLHEGITKSFLANRSRALETAGVSLAALTVFDAGEGESIPTLASADAAVFMQNPSLHREVFGPFSLLVRCKDVDEMHAVARSLEGQLTASLVATPEEVNDNPGLVDSIRAICGRLILNGVPTGVEVALAMHHGGPFPATTDSRFTAVGADGIRRFARPLCYQNWPEELLPDELKDLNLLGLWRTVNNMLTKEPVKRSR